jgi:hypothetical protein
VSNWLCKWYRKEDRSYWESKGRQGFGHVNPWPLVSSGGRQPAAHAVGDCDVNRTRSYAVPQGGVAHIANPGEDKIWTRKPLACCILQGKTACGARCGTIENNWLCKRYRKENRSYWDSSGRQGFGHVNHWPLLSSRRRQVAVRAAGDCDVQRSRSYAVP